MLRPKSEQARRSDQPILRSCFLGIAIVIAFTGVFCAPAVADELPEGLTPLYPIAVATGGREVFVVDLELPGVWLIGGAGRQLFAIGTRQVGQPLNRPRSIALHPEGGVLVGDTATREVYHIPARGDSPIPLSGGRIGIPMALAVSPDRSVLYVGDAEKLAIVKLPITGGEPTRLVDVNARGLAFDPAGTLWAVTPDDAAVQRIDVTTGNAEPVVTGRPFGYPNGLVWVGEHGWVSDGYGRRIWKVSRSGEVDVWHEGAPLVGPVGIAGDAEAIWVADPKQKQVYRFDVRSKVMESRL